MTVFLDILTQIFQRTVFGSFLAKIVLLTLLSITSASAATYGDFEYAVYNGEVTITGYNGSGGDVVIPGEIDGNSVTSIISIDAYFDNSDNIVSVFIPESVTSINESVFINCNKLEEINVDSDSSSYCSVGGVLFDKSQEKLLLCPRGKTGNYNLPSGVSTVNNYAFWGCEKITSVVLGEGVRLIGEGAFSYCDSLSYVSMSDEVESVGQYAFSYCSSLSQISIPRQVLILSEGIFSHCTSLESINLHGGITRIDNLAFKGCENLSSLDIPDSVVGIGYSAFENCKQLTSFSTGCGVKWIGRNAFQGCTSLASVNLGQAMTFIGMTVDDEGVSNSKVSSYFEHIGWYISSVFADCASLSEVNVHAENSLYSSNDGVLFEKSGTIVLKYPQAKVGNYLIPDNVTKIASYAFRGNSHIAGVGIPASIEEIGEYSFSGCSSLLDISIPGSVKILGDYAFEACNSLSAVIIGNGISRIEKGTFKDCFTLESLIVPDNVESIGRGAFKGCEQLHSVSFKGQLSFMESAAFSGCVSLRQINLPEGMVSVEKDCFYNCKSLEEVTVPEGVTSIKSHAFAGCSELVTVHLPSSLEVIEDYVFFDCVALRNIDLGFSITSLGDYIFKNCSSMESVVIPESITELSHGMFAGCSALVLVTIPGSVKTINNYAFSGCISLKTVFMPDSVMTLGQAAFSGCISLKSVEFSNNLEKLEGYVLYGCVALEQITIPSNVTEIDKDFFSGCSSLRQIVVSQENSHFSHLEGVLFNKEKTELIKHPEKKGGGYTIPETVTTVGEKAFANCSELASVDMPASLVLIQSQAFYECIGLTNLVIPENVRTIGDGAFAGCSSLASVDMPENLVLIKSGAFSGCSGLLKVSIPSSVLCIDSFAFGNCSSLKSVEFKGGVPLFDEDYYNALHEDLSIDADVYHSYMENIGLYVSNVFANCPNFEKFEVAGSNEEFCIDGVLFTRDQTRLIKCPPAKRGIYTVPGSVAMISDYAFLSCKELTEINMPDSVNVIETEAFRGCEKIKSIVIPADVRLRDYVFADCPQLRAVYFKGARPERVLRESEFEVYRKAFDDLYIYSGSIEFYEMYERFYHRWVIPSEPFVNSDNVTVFYLPSTENWTETFGERPTLIWDYDVGFTKNSKGELSGDLLQRVVYSESSTEITATPKPGYVFLGWEGDYVGTVNPLVIENVTQDMNIRAVFGIRADLAENELPEEWKQALVDADDAITSTSQIDFDGDFDEDGLTNREEYEAGTDALAFNILVENQWNLIHIPRSLSPDENSIDEIFPHKLGDLWSWDRSHGSYAGVTSLSAGDGFWMFWDADATNVTIPGEKVPQMDVTVYEGWNLVGSIYPIATPEGEAIMKIWYWDAKSQVYVPHSDEKLLPGVGYWIEATGESVISMAR